MVRDERGRDALRLGGRDRTRVGLEHRKVDRHGDTWPALRDGIAGDDGRPPYLRRFAGLFTREG
jgi:hypothetical protein